MSMPDDDDIAEFHPEAFSQGIMARLNGFSQNDRAANPYLDSRGGWLYRSFIAGWADADQSEKSKESPS